MKKIYYILLSLALLATGCEKQPQVQGVAEIPGNDTYFYVNQFAWNVMSTYYLWKNDISKGLDDWAQHADTYEPISTVDKLIYRDDKWSFLTDDYDSFFSEITGVSKSYGYDFDLYLLDQSNPSKILLCAVITYVFPDSPASQAGLKRGDTIVAVNNKDLVYNNDAYYDIVINEMLAGDSCKLTLSNGKTINLDSVVLTENPVTYYTVLENGDKKIGYMHYASFTAESVQHLIKACKYFKENGIKDLVLDLRYNGGGLVWAENALISMLAPKEAVDNEEVFEKEYYNDLLTKYWGVKESKFAVRDTLLDYDGKDYFYDTSEANLDLDNLYVIVQKRYTASASESLICCLEPFTNVELIGDEGTYGKFCAGIPYPAEEWYDDYKEDFDDPSEYKKGIQYAHNWGIYVMISRFTDRDGKTACEPNGVPVDVSVEDNPQDGCQLGDPEETMLNVALQRAGFFLGSPSNVQRAPARKLMKPVPFQRPEKPGMVRLPSEMPSKLPALLR